jgi:hypothetical protein
LKNQSVTVRSADRDRGHKVFAMHDILLIILG